MAEVLLYNVRENYDLDRFKEIAAANNVDIRTAGKEDIDQLIGYLIGLPTYEESKVSNPFDENLDFDFILFVGFERNELFAFLDLMRENSLGIQHKANETHNNVNWTLRELLIENDREGKMMGLINRINRLTAEVNQLNETKGVDQEPDKLVKEMEEYFKDSSMFELEVAQEYHDRLHLEVQRVKGE